MSEGQRGWPAGPGAVGAGGGRHWPAALQPVEQPKPVKAWIWWVAGVLLVALLGGAVWSGVKLWGAFQSSGKSEIVPLHAHMQKQEMAAIFADSDPAYQEQVGRAKSDALFQLIHDHVGDPVRYSVDNVNVATDSKEGTTETLVLTTTFTKGLGVETLKYHKVDGRWRMIAYTCHSHLLDGVKISKEIQAK